MRTQTSNPPHTHFLVFQKTLFLFGMVFLFNACGNKSPDQIAAPEGMCKVELSKYGKPFSLFVPDTSKNPFSVSEEGSGALIVKAGSSFAISISEETADLQLKRMDIESDEINKFSAYLVNEPNAILWESAITEPEYHFVLNAKVAGRDFSFQDVQNTEDKAPGKTNIQLMFNNSKAIQELAKKE
jgi:hypothetical protein